jgi:hypothetical protein
MLYPVRIKLKSSPTPGSFDMYIYRDDFGQLRSYAKDYTKEQ